MKLEWRLKQLLEKYGLDGHGMETKIANECGVHRHTVGKIIRNQVQSSKLDVLEKVCEWLIENGVPAETLPGALFGVRPSALWRAIGESDKVHIYLGEYHIKGKTATTQQPAPPVSISRHDSVVSSKIIHFLFSNAELSDLRPSVKMLYVPFYFTPGVFDTEDVVFQEDTSRAKQIFTTMRQDRQRNCSSIIIGSQRVNYLVEYIVADLFGCEPFVQQRDKVQVPFYLCYRKFDRLMPSCFGGVDNPPDKNSDVVPGTYYLDENFTWQFLEWKKKETDAGIVVITREADNVEMAAFGFSGRSTNAVGNALLKQPHNFWPESNSTQSNTVVTGDKEVGVYICKVTFSEEKNNDNSRAFEDYEQDKVEVIPLSRKVLEKYLAKNGSKIGEGKSKA